MKQKARQKKNFNKHSNWRKYLDVKIFVVLLKDLPLEWKEMRQSHKGQFSTGSFKITSSSNITTVMYLNMERRSRISFIGLDLDFLAIEHIPTAICLSGGWRGGEKQLF